MKSCYEKLLAAALCAGLSLPVYAKTDAIAQQVTKQLKTSPVVEISLHWKGMFSSYTTFCEGALVGQGDRVVTVRECFGGSLSNLQKVSLSFSNDKTAVGGNQTVELRDGLAFIRVDSQVTNGVRAVQIGRVPSGKTLQDHYGDNIGAELMAFMVSKGVPTARHRCRIGANAYCAKPRLRKGTPFFWGGKVVALFKEIPHHVEVSLFGGVAEDSLQLFTR